MVRVDNELSSPFEINKNVSHGNTLSAMLFNLYLEAVRKKLEMTEYVGIKQYNNSAYADNINLNSGDRNRLKESLITLDHEA